MRIKKYINLVFNLYMHNFIHISKLKVGIMHLLEFVSRIFKMQLFQIDLLSRFNNTLNTPLSCTEVNRND